MQNSDKLEWPAINPNGDKRYNFFKPTWVYGEYSAQGNSVLDQIINKQAYDAIEEFYYG